MRNRSSWDSPRRASLSQWLCAESIFLLGSLLTSMLYRLEPIYIVCNLIVWLAAVPFLIRTRLRNKRELERFRDACLYVSQLLYGFSCCPRILAAMEQAMDYFPKGRMRGRIYDATLLIRRSENVAQAYPEAFALMEAEYGFDRMKRTHHFLQTIESEGGEYEDGLNMLRADLHIFQGKVIALQKEKRLMLSRIWVGFLVTTVICGVTSRFMPQGADLAKWAIVQIAAILLMAVNLIALIITEYKLTGNWLKRSRVYPSGTFYRYDRMVQRGRNGMGTALARKTMTKAILEAFPGWLLDVTLLLDKGNVQTAISQSQKQAPEVLQPSLTRLTSALKVSPDSAEPFESFLEEYNLPEVSTLMRSLYGISRTSDRNTGIRIRNLAEQNQSLQRNAENSRNESSKAGLTLLSFMPILAGSGKLMVDMVSFILLFIRQL